MSTFAGVHHVAICTGDIKSQIEYFTDVLGAELESLYWMHGTEGAWHGFLRIGDSCSVAFVQMPGTDAEGVAGLSHASNGGTPSAAGTMQHLALDVATHDELLAIRDRIRSRGIMVSGPIDHGFCQSIYFAGLEGLNLEVAWSAAPIPAEQWIDPEVVGLAGITAEELERFMTPAPFEGQGGTVAQPPLDFSKPQMGYPKEILELIQSTPDEVVFEHLSEPDPPVPPRADARYDAGQPPEVSVLNSDIGRVS